MLTLLTCAVALVPSALPQRVIVPEARNLYRRAVKELLDGRVIVGQKAQGWQHRLIEPETISPYVIRPRRDIWPYSQLPAEPKPSNPWTDRARPWLIKG